LTKTARGTEIILHIDKDSKEFLEESRITELSDRSTTNSCPFPLSLEPKKKHFPFRKVLAEDAKAETVTVDNIINNPDPAWTKKPADLKEEDYKSFYRELYPMQFEEPLFNIHLNVDYPFNLTGILYFPRLNNDFNIQKDKIQLYQNQVL
jgi:molecular chaperone HtpG